MDHYIFFINIYTLLWRRQWQPTPVFLPGKSHGRRSLVGCSPWGLEESDTTEWLHFYFSLSCIGDGNGNPLQCSCLENPRDGGAWWAAICEVAQSRHNWSDLAAAAAAYFIEVQLTYNVSSAQQKDLVIYIYIYTYIIFRSFYIIGYYKIDDSSLCYTVNLCCLLHV